MIRHFRRRLAALALVAALASCGDTSLIRSFQIALAASSPLVNSLVASGVIPESKATVIIADFNEGAACALTLQRAFAAIPDDGADHTAQKLTASNEALQCWRVVINRRNFDAHFRVKQAADIAEGILASLVLFYSDSGPMRSAAEGKATVSARNEDDLERQLEAQVKALKLAMKP